MQEPQQEQTISGQIIDPVKRRIFTGHILFKDGVITALQEDPSQQGGPCILPPLVDAHIHIESSMLTPGEFAKVAVCHGTGAVVADPHEIANVLGVDGIDFMISHGKTVPLRFYFGAPSCVPATPFESSGACLDADAIATLMARDDIYFLGEMMNFPGVIQHDNEVIAKIKQAKLNHKPIDGHAPHLTKDELDTYIAAGISTDHEATTLEEALEKISKGMKILIRNGSSAKDFARLHPIISSHPLDGMLCSDDLHPDDLQRGHLDLIVKKSLEAGHHILDILQYSTVTPVRHFGLGMGLLQPGDPADFIVVDDLKRFRVLSHFCKGIKIAENNRPLFSAPSPTALNNFQAKPITDADVQVKAMGGQIKVIEVQNGELITGKSVQEPHKKEGYCIADPSQDLLKICVLNRYTPTPPAVAFVRGFGLQKGAMASSIAHDSHNIIAIGCSDSDLCEAINEVIRCKGGITYVGQGTTLSLALPVAGLMGLASCKETAERHHQIETLCKEQGCLLHAPFMAMSFLALPVIPHLKITDRGLFDVNQFNFTPLFQDSKGNHP